MSEEPPTGQKILKITKFILVLFDLYQHTESNDTQFFSVSHFEHGPFRIL